MHPSLYARCLRRLLPFLLLAGVAAAQTNPGDRVLLERGTTLDVALEHDVRMQAGVPVRARVVHPVYQGNELAIPAGAVALGHVNDVTAAPAGTYREGL